MSINEQAASYNTLTNQTVATQEFSTAIIGPSALGWIGQIALWGMVVAWAGDYCNFYLIFRWTTQQNREAYSILEPSRVNSLQPLSAGLLGVTVQSFLARRAIKLLTGRWSKRLTTAFFAIVITLELFFSIFNVVLNNLFHDEKLSGRLLRFVTYSLISGIWLWSAAVADIGVTVVLCVVLRKRIAGFNETTDRKLRALCWLAVQSASYTAFLALGGAISAYATPNNVLVSSVPFAFWYLLPSCYVLALITALCSRLVLTPPSIIGGVNVGSGLGGGAGPNSLGGVAYGGMGGRSPPLRPSPTFKPVARLIEKTQAPSVASGVHVAEEVSVHVSDGEDDQASTPARRSRSQPASRLQSTRPSLEIGKEKTVPEDIIFEQQSVGERTEGKSTWASSSAV
ncbi:hypothetical protein JCM11251_006291 [Rhodosporidiobolus azoricus]